MLTVLTMQGVKQSVNLKLFKAVLAVLVNDLNVLLLLHLVLNLYFVLCFVLELCIAVHLGQVFLVKEILISVRLKLVK